ncbi:MAG TPA: type II toxin-antitoxin system RelE/ParE family toxin [Candidatus Thermoplasmatota archaeon]|nr:type II toxin-antitoxin system RelE/ParE family toxin [Candidatus Thermoplasmatota archaeon]
MSFRVRLAHGALRDLDGLDAATQARFARAFDGLGEDPYRSRPGCDIRVLRGTKDVRAVRVGPWRALNRIDAEDGLVLVTRIARRRSAYGR